MDYDLELGKLIEKIKKGRYKTVMIQLPDGLKPKANEIADAITEKTKAEVLIWQESCFGGCDLPYGLNVLGVELLVQWGHNSFNRTEGW